MTRAVRLTPDAERALRFQAYPDAATIAGVRLTPLKKHRSENGWFMEFLRLSGGVAEGIAEATTQGVAAGPADPAARGAAEGFSAGRPEGAAERFAPRQISLSHAAPGRINAFHLHPKLPQNEIWCVVDGQLRVWLADCRAASPTAGAKRPVILSGEQPALLYIPAGVAHGYRAGGAGALLLYVMDQQFDPSDPNEGRLPWDHFGSELWDEDRG